MNDLKPDPTKLDDEKDNLFEKKALDCYLIFFSSSEIFEYFVY